MYVAALHTYLARVLYGGGSSSWFFVIGKPWNVSYHNIGWTIFNTSVCPSLSLITLYQCTVRDATESSRCRQRINACSWAPRWFIFLKEKYDEVMGQETLQSVKNQSGREEFFLYCWGTTLPSQKINLVPSLCWMLDSQATHLEWVGVI